MMKTEAAHIQLANKAINGNLRAIGELIAGYANANEQEMRINPPNLTINFVPVPEKNK